MPHEQLPNWSNFPLAAVPVEGFSWGNYINSNSFTAAPVTCFKHVSISQFVLSFSVCMNPWKFLNSFFQNINIRIFFICEYDYFLDNLSVL